MVTKEYNVLERRSERFCDFEGCKTVTWRGCCHCSKDICTKHASIDPYNSDDGSDYMDWTCDKCLEIGIPFRKIIDECRGKEYDAREEWDRVCKLNKTTQTHGGTKNG